MRVRYKVSVYCGWFKFRLYWYCRVCINANKRNKCLMCSQYSCRAVISIFIQSVSHQVFWQNTRQGICLLYNLSKYNTLTGLHDSFQVYVILIYGVMEIGKYSIHTQTETVSQHCSIRFDITFVSGCGWKSIPTALPFKHGRPCYLAAAELTHCGLVTPYGDMELGQHWLR